MRKLQKTIGAVAILAMMVLSGSYGVGNGTPPVTQADQNHPNIHQTLSDNNQANASPNGNANGNNLHGIANVPGQNADSTPGVDNLRNVHGGLCATDGGPNPAC